MSRNSRSNPWRRPCASNRYRRATALLASDSHLGKQDRARADRSAQIDVRTDTRDVAVHLLQVAGDGDLVHRIREGASLDPEAARTTRIVACHAIHALPHELGDEQA